MDGLLDLGFWGGGPVLDRCAVLCCAVPYYGRSPESEREGFVRYGGPAKVQTNHGPWTILIIISK